MDQDQTLEQSEMYLKYAAYVKADIFRKKKYGGIRFKDNGETVLT